jgi:hypothetical protein
MKSKNPELKFLTTTAEKEVKRAKKTTEKN